MTLKHIFTLTFLLLIYIKNTNAATCSTYTSQSACNGDTRCGWSSASAICTCADAVDQYIQFIMDSSGSVGSSGWTKEKTFVVDMITNSISSGSIVSVIQYANGASTVWRFTDSQVRSQITTAVNNRPFTRGVTHTRTAMERGLSLFVNTASISTMPRLMMLITDGVPNPDPEQHPCKTAGGPDLEPQLINAGIILVIVGVGTSWNPNNLACLLDRAASKGEIVTVDSFDNLKDILSQLEVYTCPIDIDFEITEMKWEGSSSYSNQLFVELFNSGDQIPFVAATSEFTFYGSITGAFTVTGTWESQTFMMLYGTTNAGNIECRDCDCDTSYGFSNSAGARHNGTGMCATGGCCNGGHLYVPLGIGSNSNGNGAYFASGTSNSNFDLAIVLSAGNGGTTVIDVAYTSAFPAIVTDYTFEKTQLYASESVGTNWKISCWQDGTPTDDPLSTCDRACGSGNDCTLNGDLNAVFNDVDERCDCSNFATSPSVVPSYYRDDTGCSCIQILNPSQCIGSAIDVGGGQYDIILSWTSSATAGVDYKITYSSGGTSGLTVEDIPTNTYTFPSVSVLSLFSAQLYAYRNTTDVRSSTISCTIVTPDPTSAATPSPVSDTPTMSCWLTVLNQYNLVAVGWTDSVPYVADYRFYQTYNGVAGDIDDYQAINVNCGSDISSYSNTDNCFKTAYFTSIADPDLVDAYMSPYVIDSGGSRRDDIMLADRVRCDVRTLTPTQAPSAGPIGGPSQSPLVEPTQTPTAAPTIEPYSILSCTVQVIAGGSNVLQVSWIPYLPPAHYTTLGFGAAVSLRWMFHPNTITPQIIDFNNPDSPQDFDISSTALASKDLTSETFEMWADFLPHPGASTSTQSQKVQCNLVSITPTESPTMMPTKAPSPKPTGVPSETPTGEPSGAPTQSPTFSPLEIENCYITLDSNPNGQHGQFKIVFDQPTFSYPSTPIATDVNYYIQWYDGTSSTTISNTQQYHQSTNGVAGTEIFAGFIYDPEGGSASNTATLNIEYDWDATVTVYYNGNAMGTAVDCIIATPAPVASGPPPTFAPVFATPMVYLDLAPESRGWKNFFCKMEANDDGEYCTDPSISNGYCTPVCEAYEKKNSASELPVARVPSDFPLDIVYTWEVFCCDYDNDASCPLSTDSCVETTRRLQSTLLDGETPAPSVDGYQAYVTEADFTGQVTSGSGSFDGYPDGDGTDKAELYLKKDNDAYNPEFMYVVITGCYVNDTRNGDPITYGCSTPIYGDPEYPGRAKVGVYENGTGSLVKKEEGDLPNWIWYVIVGGILFLGVLGWIGYRYYQKRKLNEELLEQRKQENAGLGDEDHNAFGGLGEDVRFNPLATGGTSDIATGGQFVDKQLNVQKDNFEVAQVDVGQEVFRQDFGQVQPNQHHF